ncbi:hypothetical protein ASZ90_015800 [hydrocarbon metagenome]|uniref:Uncharacterized protein n=1 Tax=hydrocarbon metagenome TaxID=938273 RepID=A0A0W8F113_9ZZZZ
MFIRKIRGVGHKHAVARQVSPQGDGWKIPSFAGEEEN